MNQITGSPIKEAMRQQNENDARNTEVQIRNKMNYDIAQIVYKNKFTGRSCGVLAVVFGIVVAVIGKSFSAFLFGIGMGVGIYILLNVWVKSQNADADAEKRRLEE